MVKRETFNTIGRNLNWYGHYGEQHGGSLKISKIRLPFRPATPLLGIYPEKIIIQNDTCNHVHYSSEDMEIA